MNFSSEDQLIAVGQLCRSYKRSGNPSKYHAIGREGISCNSCSHWDGEKCRINVFDDVLTSMDQT